MEKQKIPIKRGDLVWAWLDWQNDEEGTAVVDKVIDDNHIVVYGVGELTDEITIKYSDIQAIHGSSLEVLEYIKQAINMYDKALTKYNEAHSKTKTIKVNDR